MALMEETEETSQQTRDANPPPDWKIYTGSGKAAGTMLPKLPEPPPWRRFAPLSASKGSGGGGVPSLTTPGNETRGETYRPDANAVEMANAALYLGRPLLLTGKPGTGKSSLAYSVARELGMGPVLRWNITSRSTLKEGLYEYDALRRLADYNMEREQQIGEYITLGPLGTALLPWARPRVLLIDEIDKSDIDLPNDLLNVFEEGEFMLREIVGGQNPADVRANQNTALQVRTGDVGQPTVTISGPVVRCARFPFVILTSNGERDFPAPFLRRCLRLYLPPADETQLLRIVKAHFDTERPGFVDKNMAACLTLIREFGQKAKTGDVATDQLLNAVFMTVGASAPLGDASASGGDGGSSEAAKTAREKMNGALLRHLQTGAEISDAAQNR